MTVDWDFNLLQSLFDDRGDQVIHELGISCACKREDAYASQIEVDGRFARVRSLDCPNCQGDGFIYREPRVLRGLLTQIYPSNRELQEYGYNSAGDMTFSPDFNSRIIGDFDRITMLLASPLNEGQILIRGAAHIGQNEQQKNTRTDLDENEDRLWYIATQAIWCEDINGVVYTEGADYVFKDKKIVWSNGPDTGTAYTIKYCGYLEYVAYAGPMQRFDNARSLLQKVTLKKKHVTFMKDLATDTPANRHEAAESFTTRVKI